jgi:hypothetical protein
MDLQGAGGGKGSSYEARIPLPEAVLNQAIIAAEKQVGPDFFLSITISIIPLSRVCDGTGEKWAHLMPLLFGPILPSGPVPLGFSASPSLKRVLYTESLITVHLA